MRYWLPLSALAALLSGCSFSASSKPAPTPAPTRSSFAYTAPIPATTPPPVKGRKGRHAAHGQGSLRIAATPPPPPTPTPIPRTAFTAQIYGTVKDSKTGSPLAGAILTVGTGGAHVARTGPFGRYRLSFPAGIAAPVTVQMRGYTGGLAMGKVSAHKATKVDFQLNHITPGKPVPPSAPGVFGSP